MLLQTVALFETLLSKIKLLKGEQEQLTRDKEELLVRVQEQEAEGGRAAAAEAELKTTCEVRTPEIFNNVRRPV